MKNKLNYFIAFFSFIGFFAGLEVIFFAGSSALSRYYSVPIRLVVTVLMLFIMTKMKLRHIKSNQVVYFLFFSFWMLYFIAIFRNSMGDTSYFHITPLEFLGYSVIYGMVPFLFFSLRHDNKAYDTFKNAIIFSGFAFAVLSSLIYGKYLLSGVGRLSMAQYTEGSDFAAISPLTLSYMSTLVISICSYYLIFEKNSRFIRYFYLLTISISLVPFFLGASRGSIIAIILTFFIIVFFRGSLKTKFQSLLFFAAFGSIIVFLAGYFGSFIFERLLSLSSDIESGSSSVARLVMWKSAWQQFLSSPIWGDSIQSLIPPHPHNVFLEVIMSVGINWFSSFHNFVFIFNRKKY
jgi:O-antigen ligase